MTAKEKDKLAVLAGKIIENADILHPPLAKTIFEKIISSKDEEMLDVLIHCVELARIYEIYNRFDRGASFRDIEKLLSIITTVDGGMSEEDEWG